MFTFLGVIGLMVPGQESRRASDEDLQMITLNARILNGSLVEQPVGSASAFHLVSCLSL